LRSVLALLLLLSQLTVASGDDTKPPPIDPRLAAAGQLYRAGKFAEARSGYQALLKNDSKLLPVELVTAQVGLVRAMLRQQKIDEGLDAVNTSLWGFAMPRQLELELDYRDGLVDFKYDPKRVSVFTR